MSITFTKDNYFHALTESFSEKQLSFWETLFLGHPVPFFYKCPSGLVPLCHFLRPFLKTWVMFGHTVIMRPQPSFVCLRLWLSLAM